MVERAARGAILALSAACVATQTAERMRIPYDTQIYYADANRFQRNEKKQKAHTRRVLIGINFLITIRHAARFAATIILTQSHSHARPGTFPQSSRHFFAAERQRPQFVHLLSAADYAPHTHRRAG